MTTHSQKSQKVGFQSSGQGPGRPVLNRIIQNHSGSQRTRHLGTRMRHGPCRTPVLGY